MKNIMSITLSLLFIATSYAQVGNRKITNKNLGTMVAVKGRSSDLKKVTIPKNFDIRKTSKLNIPKNKLSLKSRRSVKITPLRPYNSNLELWYEGRYSKNYLMISSIFGGVVSFNAQRGKEYRMKVSLSNRKPLMDEFEKDYPIGSVAVLIGDQDEWHSIPVNRNVRYFSIVFTTDITGSFDIKLTGIFPPNWKWGDELWLPIKSIQVDEI